MVGQKTAKFKQIKKRYGKKCLTVFFLNQVKLNVFSKKAINIPFMGRNASHNIPEHLTQQALWYDD